MSEVRARGRARALVRPREPELKSVRDRSTPAQAGAAKVRVYEPAAADAAAIVYLHGGMWMIGDLETHDRTCRRLAVAMNARVVAVDYRRAPEHPWPAAVEDGHAAAQWVADEFACPSPILAGDSSGGHLALLVALRLRDLGAGCGGLLLACPNTDLRLSSESAKGFGQGWGLNVDSLRWAIDQWLPAGVSVDDPRVNPLFADLSGLPPVTVVTADHDPLRDEGHALAQALRDSGVSVTERCEHGMVHGFVQNLDEISATRRQQSTAGTETASARSPRRRGTAFIAADVFPIAYQKTCLARHARPGHAGELLLATIRRASARSVRLGGGSGGHDWPNPDQRGAVLKGAGIADGVTLIQGEVRSCRASFNDVPTEPQCDHGSSPPVIAGRSAARVMLTCRR